MNATNHQMQIAGFKCVDGVFSFLCILKLSTVSHLLFSSCTESIFFIILKTILSFHSLSHLHLNYYLLAVNQGLGRTTTLLWWPCNPPRHTFSVTVTWQPFIDNMAAQQFSAGERNSPLQQSSLFFSPTWIVVLRSRLRMRHPPGPSLTQL